jgi:hypothetical protein
MRMRWITVLVLLFASLMLVNAQDLDATATAIIEGATQTAIWESTHTIELQTEDPFALTATALVRAATQTAEVFTGETAVPITVEAQVEGSYEMTATALIMQATQNVLEGTPSPFGTGEGSEEDNDMFALSATFFIFGGLLLALGVLGAVIVMAGRGNTGKRG